MSLKLIRVFKNLFTRGAFGFLLREVFGHGSRTQEPFVLPHGLFPSAVFIIFHVVLHLLAVPLFFHTVFLFLCPLFFLPLLSCDFLPFGVLLFLQSLSSGLFHSNLFRDVSGYSVLTLDVLLHPSLCAVSERTLRAGE